MEVAGTRRQKRADLKAVKHKLNTKRAEGQSSSGASEEVNSSLLSFQLRVHRLNSFPLSRKSTRTLCVRFETRMYRENTRNGRPPSLLL
jgi:hypothetical protein